MAVPPGGPRSALPLGAAVKDLKDRFFVGRKDECHQFAACLSGTTGEWRVLNIHGPGGVGKSTLLDAFRRLAEDAGALYVYLDTPDLPRSPRRVVDKLATVLNLAGGKPSLEGCLHHLHAEAARRPIVLVFDTYEDIGALDRWLREAFLVRLPERALVVMAGRFPLQGLWRESPAWRQLVCSLPLAPFDLHLTRQYLALHNIADESLVQAAWTSTRGHPLALSLAAALVRHEGPDALVGATDRPEVVAELARRWLREVPDDRLRTLLEAAATVRRFDQDLLAHQSGTPVTTGEFNRLTALSFVRLGRLGWSVHSLVRSALVRELRWRSPTHLTTLRQRALNHHLALLTQTGLRPDWSMALEEFFYLLGDALIRAVFFHEDEDLDTSLYVVPATRADLPELRAYFDVCRSRAEAAGPTAFEMVDPNTGSHFSYSMPWVDFVRAPLDIPALMGLGPGVVRMARDASGTLRGLSVIIPVNAATLPNVERQPVTGPYFRQLTPEERAEYAVPEDQTAAWYIRHINTHDLGDAAARGALFRDLFQITFRNGRLLTSSPVPFFQDLLRRCGFVDVPGATHHDFGADFPSPTYLLDVRGPRLAAFLFRLINGGAVPDPADATQGALAGALAERLSAWAADRSVAAAVEHPTASGTALGLTPREREVALAVMDGLSNSEIADRMGISELTVKKHLTRTFTKAGVVSRTQLIRKLLFEGF